MINHRTNICMIHGIIGGDIEMSESSNRPLCQASNDAVHSETLKIFGCVKSAH